MLKPIAVILVYVVVEMFFSMIALVAIGSLQQEEIVMETLFMPNMIYSGIAFILFQLLIVIGFFKIISKIFWENSPFKGIIQMRFFDLFLGFVVTLFLLLIISFLQILVKFQSFQVNTMSFRYLSVGLLLALLISIKEEIIFRGFLLKEFEKKTGRLKAILLSSLFFGVIHSFTKNFGLFSFLDVFISGIILCLAFYKSNNIWYPVGIHFGWNYFLLFIYGVGTDLDSMPYISGVELVPSNWTDTLELVILILVSCLFYKLYGNYNKTKLS